MIRVQVPYNRPYHTITLIHKRCYLAFDGSAVLPHSAIHITSLSPHPSALCLNDTASYLPLHGSGILEIDSPHTCCARLYRVHVGRCPVAQDLPLGRYE